MPKDARPEPEASPLREPTRIESLRAAVAALKIVKVERIEGDADTKPHVKASWGRTRVAHVADTCTLDQSEIAVLESVLANLAAS